MKSCLNKTNNFFAPKFSKRFVISKFQGFQLDFTLEKNNSDVNMEEIAIPVGIIDDWKLNNAYKQLLTEINIQDWDNKYVLVVISDQINKHKNDEWSQFEVDTELFYDNEQINEDKSSIAEKNIYVIFLWRTSDLLVSSISFKVGICLNIRLENWFLNIN